MEKLGRNKLDIQKVLAPAALVILYIFFSFAGNNFFTLDTFKNILESSYYIGFMAFGVTFIIITGGIDLSLGTVMMCSALLGAYVFKQLQWSLVAALLVTLGVGVFFGFLNGIFVAKLKLPPFISTLGTMMMSQGIGSNEEAARLSGINVDNWKVAVYTLSGFFVGMAGIMYAAAYTTITPGTGNGQEMNGITGVVIGGTSMSGGSGTMAGTLIGVFIMAVLKNGLSACGLQAPWQTFFTGLVVIGAVLLDIYRTKAANKVKKS